MLPATVLCHCRGRRTFVGSYVPHIIFKLKIHSLAMNSCRCEDQDVEQSVQLRRRCLVNSNTFQPLDQTFSPLVWVIKCDVEADRSAELLITLEKLNFSRGARLVVTCFPEQPWRRESQQDQSPEDTYVWGTLMPLYFKVERLLFQIKSKVLPAIYCQLTLVCSMRLDTQSHRAPVSRFKLKGIALGHYVHQPSIQKHWHSDNGFIPSVRIKFLYDSAGQGTVCYIMYSVCTYTHIFVHISKHPPWLAAPVWLVAYQRNMVTGGHVVYGIVQDWISAARREYLLEL